MNITSLLITLVGIIIIIALYIMSRIAQSKLPKKHTSIIPNLKNEDGSKFTSVLDDIPARDGSSPTKAPAKKEPAKAPDTVSKEEEKKDSKKIETTQHILFISAKDEQGLDGNLIQQGLLKNGFVYGDMDIYHYLVDTHPGKASLFRVANGMSPWTLTNEDLLDKKLAGLSVVMLIPSKIDDKTAINTFITITENLCRSVDGILKNQQQQPFSTSDKEILLSSVKN